MTSHDEQLHMLLDRLEKANGEFESAKNNIRGIYEELLQLEKDNPEEQTRTMARRASSLSCEQKELDQEVQELHHRASIIKKQFE
jgi:uncharacterized protein (UPF0335 family)